MIGLIERTWHKYAMLFANSSGWKWGHECRLLASYIYRKCIRYKYNDKAKNHVDYNKSWPFDLARRTRDSQYILAVLGLLIALYILAVLGLLIAL